MIAASIRVSRQAFESGMSSKKAQLAEKLKHLSPEQREALLAKLKAKKAQENIQLSIKDKSKNVRRRF